MTFAELAEHCGRFVDQLDDRRPRSPEERLALVEGVRLLLIACQRSLYIGEYTPGTPEQTLARGMPGTTVESAYSQLFESRKRELRLEIITRAADFLLKDSRRVEAFRRSNMDVSSSDERLVAALRSLEELTSKR